MRTLILLIIASVTLACSSARTAGTNSSAHGDRKTVYKTPEKLDQPPEYVAEQTKHEKWKREREEYLNKVNEAEKTRLDAIRKCESERFKQSLANNNTETGSEENTLTCEEQNPPVH